MKTICVIAGNQRQFGDFIQGKISLAQNCRIKPGEAVIDGARYLYVRNVDSIRGLSDVEFAFVGLWYERPDIDELKQAAAYRLLGDGKAVPWHSSK